MQTDQIARAAALQASAHAQRIIRLNVATELFGRLAVGPAMDGGTGEGVKPAVVNGPLAKWCWDCAGLLMQEAGLA
ncbi:MAG TPA: hypothetical protein VJR90_11330 [Gammaproteobacteria bacterium]|nr:hypothetical protein [Gammaproteobacteria bacterium]